MNNSDVLRMVRGTTPISVILERINRSDPDFTLFPGDIRRLREQHVPDSVIDAMMARNQGKNVDLPVQNTGCSAPLPGKPRTPGQPALIVNDSTPVRLRLLNNLSSAYLHLDDRVDFEVLQDVSPQIDSAGPHFLVIPREALAYGTVTAVNPTKVLGRYGSVEVALDHVCLANGDKIALREGRPPYPSWYIGFPPGSRRLRSAAKGSCLAYSFRKGFNDQRRQGFHGI
jgi:hypothetical protein